MPRTPAARTAFGPMVIAAVEQFEPPTRRILTDPLRSGSCRPRSRWSRACAGGAPGGTW